MDEIQRLEFLVADKEYECIALEQDFEAARLELEDLERQLYAAREKHGNEINTETAA